MRGKETPEVRRNKRHAVRVPAEVHSENLFFTGFLQDISAGGGLLEIRAGSPLKGLPSLVGTQSKLIIDDGKDLLEFPCEIRHLTECFMGIQFSHLAFEDMMRIKNIVASHSAS